ncbi:MAG: hypothetical protein WC788_06480 [Candidatus Paceibacterota bacterium]|jgi:hypothetical protein
MKKRFFAQLLLVLFFTFLPFSANRVIAAACPDGTCDWKAGEDIFNCKADCGAGIPSKAFTAALHDLTGWILGFATAICVIMIIIGGLYYIMSTGNQEQAQTGKKIVQYSLMGLVVVGISYALIVVVSTILT